jgi:uncharacterized membrane protein (DUF373 family)
LAVEDHPDRIERANSGIRLFEDLIYCGVAVLLILGAGALLVTAGITLVTELFHDAEEAVKSVLDLLLLVFILVELLGAVRTTLRERKLLAEPFLIVGMIASIKEIVVVSISAKDSFGAADSTFEDAMLEIGLLAALLVALALAMFLTRLKERQPEE